MPSFPDKPRPGSTQTLATIDNVVCLLAQAGIRCRYNVIKKKVEIDLPGHHGTADNRDNVTVTAIVSAAAKHGMPTGLVPEYVNAIADRNAYNPVADWIRSKPWDGTDRLEAFYATVNEQPEYPACLKGILLHKWLLSAAAAALVHGYKGRGVLTLQGPQGIGKTSWVKALITDAALRDEVVKLDHHLDGNNKDSVLGAICNWIVEIGELDSSFRKDIARLKGFLTADSDRVRRPYDRRESEYPRRTVFVATVNETSFLVDPTGNTRWWTIAVKDLDFRHQIDMQQLFAQLAVALDGGAEWWLSSDEETMLEAWNSNHRAVSVIGEMLDQHIDRERGQQVSLTATQVLELIGIERPTNAQAKECGAALREMFGEPKRIQGRYKWHVPMRKPSAGDLKPTLQAVIDEQEIY